MNWINGNVTINVNKYKAQFKKNGIITIPYFLNDNIANKLHEYIHKEMPHEWWYISSLQNDGNKMIESLNDINNEKELEIKKHANKMFSENKFSYVFYRTYKNHYDECNCMECQVRQYFSQPMFIQYMSKLLGLPLKQLNELFLSKYNKDCFLTIHNDNGNGKIAWVFNLTPNWQSQWGGNFILLNQNRIKVDKFVTPQFNSLTVFRIPERIGIPHYVSHVVKENENRYAISGWFS